MQVVCLLSITIIRPLESAHTHAKQFSFVACQLGHNVSLRILTIPKCLSRQMDTRIMRISFGYVFACHRMWLKPESLQPLRLLPCLRHHRHGFRRRGRGGHNRCRRHATLPLNHPAARRAGAVCTIWRRYRVSQGHRGSVGEKIACKGFSRSLKSHEQCGVPMFSIPVSGAICGSASSTYFVSDNPYDLLISSTR